VCQECGCTPEESGRALSVHHIRPFKNFGIAHHEEANALTNLTSLCHTCHASREHLQKTMPFFEQHG
jgi:5-methylcytosine-specific restriction endonuclease McrA